MWNPLDGLATVNVRFKIIHPAAKMPFYGSSEAAGADLYAVGNHQIPPMTRMLVPTGLVIQLPPGFEAQCRPRSGLAVKHGITVLNAPGTIDSDYRGEIGVILMNTDTDHTVFVEPGDRIAQLVITPIFRANFMPAKELDDSDRGAGGFGSTGVS